MTPLVSERIPASQLNVLVGKLESILFVAGKPLTISKLMGVTGASKQELAEAVVVLAERHSAGSGFRLLQHAGEVELVTNPSNTELVREFLKTEELGELTRPQLEALAVIAYRGPVPKSELEMIRGVNCSLILRNLQIRGLVEQLSEVVVPTYQVAADFLRFLGLTTINQLPNFSELNSPAWLDQLLQQPNPGSPSTIANNKSQ